MARPRINLNKGVPQVEEEVKGVPQVEEEKAPPVEEKQTSPKLEEFEYPVIGFTGKFHAVPVEGGYVVYNPSGQRITGIINKIAADDIVRNNNQAAHIKK